MSQSGLESNSFARRIRLSHYSLWTNPCIDIPVYVQERFLILLFLMINNLLSLATKAKNQKILLWKFEDPFMTSVKFRQISSYRKVFYTCYSNIILQWSNQPDSIPKVIKLYTVFWVFICHHFMAFTPWPKIDLKIIGEWRSASQNPRQRTVMFNRVKHGERKENSLKISVLNLKRIMLMIVAYKFL